MLQGDLLPDNTMLTLNLIGCGKLGRTLSRLWQETGLFQVQDICTSSFTSAGNACDFIGAGQPAKSIAAMRPADLWLLATPDDRIAAVAGELASSGQVDNHSCIFHCSGALGSGVLSALSAHTTLLASVHPVHSFADPEKSLRGFSGSYCAHEGNDQALQQLIPAFEAIGARLIKIRAEDKVLYHAASVFACNYLVALLDTSLQCFARAGIEANVASDLLLPLVHQTVDNTLLQSPGSALTGPIARADCAAVARQLAALENQSTAMAELYRGLGRQALEIARDKQPDDDRWLEMSAILQRGGQQ